MKKFLSLILFFSLSAVYGQSGHGNFNLDSLPAKVTGQWKFHAGDKPMWADTAFDDLSWPRTDPTLPSRSLPPVGWFRLSLNVAPALRGKAVALIVNQAGAAEVYFNGVLIRTMGKVVDGNNKEEDRLSLYEPLTLQLSSAPKQYIAIRYSFNRSNPVIGLGYPVIWASFNQVDRGWDIFFQRVTYYTTRAWVSGSFMLLAILQLAIYFFNRDRKVNLYLSLYALMQLFTLCNGLLLPIIQGTNAATAMHAVFIIAAPLDFIFLMLMAFAFFGYQRSNWFKVLAAFCLPVIAIQFISNYTYGESILAIYNLLCYMQIIALSMKALRHKKDGAALFLAGIVVAATFFVLFNVGDLIGVQSDLVVNIEVMLAFLPPAIILSVLLAREFANNLTSLRQKLAEVESLSAQTLQQELEKQQILAKQNETLEQKVNDRTAELNKLLNNLKATQTQLIQSEKMASLGELTAGIAHEIQNPLNFVNNFSEVNKEMVEELEEELKKGNITEALAIAADIKGNEEKINHHGKRADFIVKGMLQHSRTSTGEKQLTNINTLADEFLKLSYHGLRAKDKNFNAELVTQFDESLPKVNIAQQDIGRVLLNLFNNAFYAVNQKKKTAGEDYEPTVEVTTRYSLPLQGVGGLEIKVKDNGNGIPDAIKDKIMQPFFTTKPTGEGTGLGLSLSYDIVVKGHGGSIGVDTIQGEGSVFTVYLPIN